MDLPGSEGIFSAIGGAVASAAASIATMGRRFAKRIATLEAKVAALEKLVEGLERGLEDRLRRHLDRKDRGSQREIVDVRAYVRKVATDIAKEEVASVCTTTQRDIDRIDRELRAVRAIADGSTPGGTFAEHLGSEADRWNEVHRTLGQIEGTLTAIRGRLKG